VTAWAIWYGLSFIGFVSLEAYAIMHGKPTLSRTVWDLQWKYPYFAFVAGIGVGSLAVHFFGLIPACRS
jgi:hypothetical protein